MGTLQTWRRAYGAIKDSTKVGLARINSDYAELDVAIVKATNHVECPPKERHLGKIAIATSALRPRADVAYCIHALSRRLAKTHNWTVALKTLIVIHRLLREGDPTFREELLNFSQRGRILQLSNFKDDSSPVDWDCSAWVRTYGLFLEERLECFSILKYDIEAERLPKAAPGQEKSFSRTRELDSEELLELLVGCRPEGAAVGNYAIQYALALVLKESFKIYCAINDGIIDLVDKFKCHDVKFRVLREPPQSFLATMEEYIREAARVVSVPNEPLFITHLQTRRGPSEDTNSAKDEPEPAPAVEVAVSSAEVASPTHVATPHNNLDIGDLLGLNFTSPDVSAIEERNAWALTIVPMEQDFDATRWELALVDTPSTNMSSANEGQLAGGLDSLTLNSLYDDAPYRAAQRPVYSAPAPKLFEIHDPFAMSNASAPPAAFQMAPNPFGGSYQPSYMQQQPQQHMMMSPANPFGDERFGAFLVNHMTHPQANNPFGSTGLL